ncbi:MAG: hypothetical protein DRO88_01830 [Promethearchaeia archaeon]|nr:MAG: hypothetical protein DRO88_01830 [Candidatus Lokiarchaeia archaeon]
MNSWNRYRALEFSLLLLLCFSNQYFYLSTAYSESYTPNSFQILWHEWDSKNRLNNDSVWIEFPDLAPAPSLNFVGIPITLGIGENTTFTYGLIGNHEVFIYLDVNVGDLNLKIFTNGELLYNSSNYAEYSEYYSFIPQVSQNYSIEISHSVADLTLDAKGTLYIRQQMVLAGTKMNFFMNASSDDYNTLFLRVDQDFGGVNISHDKSLLLRNLTIFHNRIYLDRDDYYSFLVYENTYDVIYPSELIPVDNQKFSGLQTLKWACQKEKFDLPILNQKFNNSSKELNISGLLPYKPEIGQSEVGTGFPAGSYIMVTSLSGSGMINLTIYNVDGEELYENSSPDYDNSPSTNDTPAGSSLIDLIPVPVLIVGIIAVVGIGFFLFKIFSNQK